MKSFDLDETLFSTILSNALDNALNAQKDLDEGKRSVSILFKSYNGRTYLSIKNPYSKAPTFFDGMPINRQPGHGYGTQSIKLLTERLQGNCQFSIKNGFFYLRIII